MFTLPYISSLMLLCVLARKEYALREDSLLEAQDLRRNADSAVQESADSASQENAVSAETEHVGSAPPPFKGDNKPRESGRGQGGLVSKKSLSQ